MKELTRVETSQLVGGRASERRCNRIYGRAIEAANRGNDRKYARLRDRYNRIC